MNAAQKKTFIRELARNVERYALDKVTNMPEEWDGIELRWYLAEKFQASTLNTKQDRLHQRRKREYDNEILVRNL